MESTDKPPIGGVLLESLMILCRYHQVEAHADALITGLPLQHGKLTPSTFERAATRANFHSKIVKTSLQKINSALFPAILLLSNDMACVIKSMNDESCCIIFPDLPDSEINIPNDQLNKLFKGYVIYARPHPLIIQDQSFFDKSENGHWFWAVINQNKALYNDIIISAIVINLMAIAMPMFIMNIYDRVVPNNAFSTLWVLAIGMFILLSADLILKLLRTWFVDLASNRTDIKISSKIMSHSLAISLDKKPSNSGVLISSVQSFESVRSFISSITITTLADLPFLFLFMLIIAIINWVLVIPILFGSFLIFIYALISQQNMRTIAKNCMEFSTQRNDLLIDSISDLETIKSLNLQNKIQSKWEKITIFLSTNSSKMRFLSSTVSQGSVWIQQVTGISIIILGVYQISKGNLSQGGLIASYLLSTRALMPVSQCASLISQFHQASTAMDALEKIMSIPEESNPKNIKIDKSCIRGKIEFHDVSFSYPESDISALSRVSFTINPGEHVAIIGKNGSGKSTIEKLITGLHAPSSGYILIDSVNINQIDKSQLRRQIGYVPQDINLIKGSLKSNIIASRSDFLDSQVIDAADKVDLSNLIHHHPKGILMPIEERGRNLSGGQKQAVGIARAIIIDPAIFILDEPTSSLDHASEEKITALFTDIAKNKTMVLITHRSALLALAHRLIVIDQGKIVADGPKEIVIEALRQGRVEGAS